MENLPEEALVQVAAYFQALSEPTRLQILNLLRSQERSVGELAALCGCSVANVSRHLSLMTRHGLVGRQSRGASVIYSIADPAIYTLCDLVCGSIGQQAQRRASSQAVFLRPVSASPHTVARAPSHAAPKVPKTAAKKPATR